LNAPEPATGNEDGINGDNSVGDSPEDQHAQVARSGMPPQGGMPASYGMTPDQAMQYQQYLQQQNAGGYAMPPQARMPTHPQHQ